MADFTKQVTVTTAGIELLTFDVADLQALLIVPDDEIALYNQRGTEGDGMKLLSTVGLAITHQDFDSLAKQAHIRKTLSAKVAAVNTTVSVFYWGR